MTRMGRSPWVDPLQADNYSWPRPYQRRCDIHRNLRPNLDRKIDHFLAHFFAVFKKHRENTRGLPKVQKPVQKVPQIRKSLSGDFWLRHFEYAHPRILASLARSELKSCMWYFSDPELIAKALKCKKMLKIQGFPCFLHNVAQRWYPGIIVGPRCVRLGRRLANLPRRRWYDQGRVRMSRNHLIVIILHWVYTGVHWVYTRCTLGIH